MMKVYVFLGWGCKKSKIVDKGVKNAQKFAYVFYGWPLYKRYMRWSLVLIYLYVLEKFESSLPKS